MTDRPYDPGLQNERTALAWTRTALALLAASAIVARLALDRIGAAAMAVVLGMIPLALWGLAVSARRYRTAQRALHDESALPDARLPVAMTLLTVLIGLAELLYVLG